MLNKLIAVLAMVVMPLGFGSSSVFAYSIDDVEVIRYGERYLITFEARVDAPIDDVKEVIYNFEQASKLTPKTVYTIYIHWLKKLK